MGQTFEPDDSDSEETFGADDEGGTCDEGKDRPANARRSGRSDRMVREEDGKFRIDFTHTMTDPNLVKNFWNGMKKHHPKVAVATAQYAQSPSPSFKMKFLDDNQKALGARDEDFVPAVALVGELVLDCYRKAATEPETHGEAFLDFRKDMIVIRHYCPSRCQETSEPEILYSPVE